MILASDTAGGSAGATIEPDAFLPDAFLPLCFTHATGPTVAHGASRGTRQLALWAQGHLGRAPPNRTPAAPKNGHF